MNNKHQYSCNDFRINISLLYTIRTANIQTFMKTFTYLMAVLGENVEADF